MSESIPSRNIKAARLLRFGASNFRNQKVQ
jgi:hypothetical protein